MDNYILEAAIVGLLEQRNKIDATIAEVQARLGGATTITRARGAGKTVNRHHPLSSGLTGCWTFDERDVTSVIGPTDGSSSAPKPGKRGSKRGQNRVKAVEKPRQRRMSKAGREAIAAAQRKRWAKIRREQRQERAKARYAKKRPAPRMVEMEATA